MTMPIISNVIAIIIYNAIVTISIVMVCNRLVQIIYNVIIISDYIMIIIYMVASQVPPPFPVHTEAVICLQTGIGQQIEVGCTSCSETCGCF